ncbi:MAG: Uncharacterised protein [SAR116 cluster bacterium]|nr:MAG: Uncharacterised protein [SAR116 cluster bacterium]
MVSGMATQSPFSLMIASAITLSPLNKSTVCPAGPTPPNTLVPSGLT